MLQPLRDDDTRKKSFIASRMADFVHGGGQRVDADIWAAIEHGPTTLGMSFRNNLTRVVVPRSSLDTITVSFTGVLSSGPTTTLPDIQSGQIATLYSSTRSPEFARALSGLVSYVWGRVEHPPLAVSDSVIIALEKLEPGWAGAGSIPPSQEIIDQVGIVLDHLPANASMPYIEVEEEDGSVSLRWIIADRSRSFSLVFRGNGRVTGVVATVNPPRSKTWTAAVTDEARIASAFEDHSINEVITG